MEYTKLLGITVAAAIICMLLKGISREHAPLFTAAVGIFVMGYAISAAAPYIDLIKDLGGDRLTSQVSAVLKALSVGIMTTVASEICRSAGENEIAGFSELIGKCTMLTLALPLLEGIIRSSGELLS